MLSLTVRIIISIETENSDVPDFAVILKIDSIKIEITTKIRTAIKG